MPHNSSVVTHITLHNSHVAHNSINQSSFEFVTSPLQELHQNIHANITQIQNELYSCSRLQHCHILVCFIMENDSFVAVRPIS